MPLGRFWAGSPGPRVGIGKKGSRCSLVSRAGNNGSWSGFFPWLLLLDRLWCLRPGLSLSWAQAQCLAVQASGAWLLLPLLLPPSLLGAFVLVGKASENSSSDSAVKPTGAGTEGWKWRKLTISLKILLLIWSLVPSEVALMSWNPLPGPLLPVTSIRTVCSWCGFLPACEWGWVPVLQGEHTVFLSHFWKIRICRTLGHQGWRHLVNLRLPLIPEL